MITLWRQDIHGAKTACETAARRARQVDMPAASPSRKHFTGSFTTGVPEVPQTIVVAIEDREQIVEHFAKYPVTE
jgi:hypothetical protein